MNDLLLEMLILFGLDVSVITCFRDALKFIAFGALNRAKGRARYKELRHKSKLWSIITSTYLLPHVKEKRREEFKHYLRGYWVYLAFGITMFACYLTVVYFAEHLSVVVIGLATIPKLIILSWFRIKVYKHGFRHSPTIGK